MQFFEQQKWFLHYSMSCSICSKKMYVHSMVQKEKKNKAKHHRKMTMRKGDTTVVSLLPILLRSFNCTFAFRISHLHFATLNNSIWFAQLHRCNLYRLLLLLMLVAACHIPIHMISPYTSNIQMDFARHIQLFVWISIDSIN